MVREFSFSTCPYFQSYPSIWQIFIGIACLLLWILKSIDHPPILRPNQSLTCFVMQITDDRHIFNTAKMANSEFPAIFQQTMNLALIAQNGKSLRHQINVECSQSNSNSLWPRYRYVRVSTDYTSFWVHGDKCYTTVREPN